MVISVIAGCLLCCCCCVGIALCCRPKKDLAGEAKSEKEADSNGGNNEDKETYSNNVIVGVESPSKQDIPIVTAVVVSTAMCERESNLHNNCIVVQAIDPQEV